METLPPNPANDRAQRQTEGQESEQDQMPSREGDEAVLITELKTKHLRIQLRHMECQLG